MRLKTNQNGVFYIDNDEMYMEPEKIDTSIYLISESQMNAFAQKLHALGDSHTFHDSATVTDEIVPEIIKYSEECFGVSFTKYTEKL